jgi:hypothetical protein
MMIRKTVRRRPEFESLESMLLLSGIAVHRHHAAEALVAPAMTSPLSGTASGTFSAGKRAAAGEPVSLTTHGYISPVGRVTETATFPLFGSTGPQNVTMSIGHDKVTSTMSAVEFGIPVSYEITGATGKFTSLIGDSGEAVLSVVPSVKMVEGRFPTKGHFTITFGSTPA